MVLTHSTLNSTVTAAVTPVEFGPIAVVAGPPAQLLPAGATAAAAAEPGLEFVARSELDQSSSPATEVFFADAFGNPARFAPVPRRRLLPGQTLPGEGEGEGEEGGAAGEGAGEGRGGPMTPSGDRPPKRARRDGAGTPVVVTPGGPAASDEAAGGTSSSGGGPECWQVRLLLRHRVVPPGGSPQQPSPLPPQRIERDQQLSLLPLGADGRCAVPSLPLASLPLSDAGDYVLVARVVRKTGGHQQQQQQQQQQQGAVMGEDVADDLGGLEPRAAEVVVVRYQIASADAASLLRKLCGARAARQQLRRDAGSGQRMARLKRGEADRVAQAAAEAERLAAATAQQLEQCQQQLARCERLLENHPQQRLQGCPLLLAARNAHNVNLPPALLDAVASRAVLGRVIWLGAVERSDVNRTLCSAILGGSLRRIACLSRGGAAAARAADPNAGRWDLTNRDMASAFTGVAVEIRHRQRPLRAPLDLQRLCSDGVLELEAYSPQHGFVGMAVNLIHMTREQLEVEVVVNGVIEGARAWWFGLGGA
jgi:hypothetical protein